MKPHKAQVAERQVDRIGGRMLLFTEFEALMDLSVGDSVFISKAPHSTVSEIFTEACDSAKTGDTNALAALPYLAELLIKESNR